MTAFEFNTLNSSICGSTFTRPMFTVLATRRSSWLIRWVNWPSELYGINWTLRFAELGEPQGPVDPVQLRRPVHPSDQPARSTRGQDGEHGPREGAAADRAVQRVELERGHPPPLDRLLDCERDGAGDL